MLAILVLSQIPDLASIEPVCRNFRYSDAGATGIDINPETAWETLMTCAPDQVTATFLRRLPAETTWHLLPRNPVQWPSQHDIPVMRSVSFEVVSIWHSKRGPIPDPDVDGGAALADLLRELLSASPLPVLWRSEEQLKADVARRIRWTAIEAIVLTPNHYQTLEELQRAAPEAIAAGQSIDLVLQSLKAMAFSAQNRTVLGNSWTPPRKSSVDQVISWLSLNSEGDRAKRRRIAALEVLHCLKDEVDLSPYQEPIVKALDWYMGLEELDSEEITRLRAVFARNDYAWRQRQSEETKPPRFSYNYSTLRRESRSPAEEWVKQLSAWHLIKFAIRDHGALVLVVAIVLIAILVIFIRIVIERRQLRQLVEAVRSELKTRFDEINERLKTEANPRFGSLEEATAARIIAFLESQDSGELEDTTSSARTMKEARDKALSRAEQYTKNFAVGLRKTTEQICAIGTNDIHIGTGLLLQNGIVLTAAHVAAQIESIGNKCYARFGCTTREKLASAAKCPIEDRIYLPDEGTPSRNGERRWVPDYALLNIGGKTPKKPDTFPQSYVKLLANEVVLVMGHPFELNEKNQKVASPMQYSFGRLATPPDEESNFVLTYNAQTRQGSSGSPVLNESLELIGVHYSGRAAEVWVNDNNKGYWIDFIAADVPRNDIDVKHAGINLGPPVDAPSADTDP